VKKNSFTNCNGFGKGTYAIDQNAGINYNNPNNYATISNHHLNNYNSNGYGGNVQTVIIYLNFRDGILNKEIL
jgi:hypothetical protein